jgi:Uma2 family endonuclease
MAAIATHRFSVADYHRMAETGLLKPDARVELLDGRIIDMSPIGPFHGGVTGRLNQWFNLQSRNRWLVWVQNPLHLDDYSEPEPDLMLLRPAPDFYTSRHPVAEDVFLLIEVADSTLDYDREEKLSAYARAGVAEVWVVNLVDRCIESYREPSFVGYAKSATFRAGDAVSPAAFPGVGFPVSELFPPK